MSILNYFKPPRKDEDGGTLPSPHGSLSKMVPSSRIAAANKEVEKVLENGKPTARGSYGRYTPQTKASVGNYARLHGVQAAIRHFKKDFPKLKWSTVHDWKVAIVAKEEEERKAAAMEESAGEDIRITKLHGKRRGRPSILSDELTAQLKAYVITVREAGGVINSAIVMAAGTGMLMKTDPGSLMCNGGTIELKKSWAKHFLRNMNYVKRKGTTKSKSFVQNFDELKSQYLSDILSIVTFEEIPDSLVINWDQTGINYVPVSQWTMAVEGSKRVEIAGADDKRQITAVFGASLAGDFLPPQLVYTGKTSKCLPTVEFPNDWDITCTPNHWCNTDTTIRYIKNIIIPYVRKTNQKAGRPNDAPALVIFDEFKGQNTDLVYDLLRDHNLYHVLIPANCTDRLQPLDLSVNKSAKEFLRARFQEWYAERIVSHFSEPSAETSTSTAPSCSTPPPHPVDLKMSTMKPLGAKWLIELEEYLKTKPDIIKNGFRSSGITETLHTQEST